MELLGKLLGAGAGLLGTLVRTGLGALGGYLVGKGYIDAQTSADLVTASMGVVTILLAAIGSYFNNKTK